MGVKTVVVVNFKRATSSRYENCRSNSLCGMQTVVVVNSKRATNFCNRVYGARKFQFLTNTESARALRGVRVLRAAP